jgi:hypothetical protein
MQKRLAILFGDFHTMSGRVPDAIFFLELP